MTSEFKALFYQALGEPIGIILECSEPQRLIQKLHTARRELKDPALDVLTISLSRSDPDSRVWIVRRSPDGEEK